MSPADYHRHAPATTSQSALLWAVIDTPLLPPLQPPPPSGSPLVTLAFIVGAELAAAPSAPTPAYPYADAVLAGCNDNNQVAYGLRDLLRAVDSAMA